MCTPRLQVPWTTCGGRKVTNCTASGLWMMLLLSVSMRVRICVLCIMYYVCILIIYTNVNNVKSVHLMYCTVLYVLYIDHSYSTRICTTIKRPTLRTLNLPYHNTKPMPYNTIQYHTIPYNTIPYIRKREMDICTLCHAFPVPLAPG